MTILKIKDGVVSNCLNELQGTVERQVELLYYRKDGRLIPYYIGKDAELGNRM